MDGMVPPSVKNVEAKIQSMVEELQKQHLVPLQKEAFLCCARCCDHPDNVAQLQNCVERCSKGSAQAQKLIQVQMHDFQERFQRCAIRCQDLARDAGDERAAEKKFMSCMEDCGQESLGRIPRMKSDIISNLQRL